MAGEGQRFLLNPTEQALVRLALQVRHAAVAHADALLDQTLDPLRATYGVTGPLRLEEGVGGYAVVV